MMMTMEFHFNGERLLMKACIKCNMELPLDSFYSHPEMADGRLNKCKECVKASVRANRAAKIDYYRDYDKARTWLPKRVQARADYAKTEAYKASSRAAKKRYVAAHRDRANARTKLRRAVLAGYVIPHPCFVCGDSKVQGHHPDYSSPLDVVWLCAKHHADTHRMCRVEQ